MDFEMMLAGLARAPWRDVARIMLIGAGYDVTRGYPQTVDQLRRQQPDPIKMAKLSASMTEHLVAGEKYLQFIQLQPGERAVVDQWIRSKRRHTNDLTAAFPGVAPESKITPFRHQDPTSAGFAVVEEGVAALYTAARWYTKTEKIASSSLLPSAAAGYERIVGYKTVVVQTYDAIWLPPAGDVLVLCVDYPDEGTTQGFPLAGADFLRALVRQALGRPILKANFWHAIDSLYNSTEGKLVAYGFSAGGQSVNHHNARRQTSVCLRKAVYDAGGAAAIQASGKVLELFRAAFAWQCLHGGSVVSRPEVLIPGVAKDLNKGSAVVDNCVVRDCLTTGDLNLVVSKLLPLIKSWV
ncbi:TPA: hypothetical protein UOA93_000685 [Stenotrophomonas maltophilia]|nr:hypothetical protein [Stenotrophomonas maltophilia]